MNTIQKVLFWIFTIALGFVNPLISFGLIILYYLPGIIHELCQSCKNGCQEAVNISEEYSTGEKEYFALREKHVDQKMDSYSEDTLEGMK
jgi:hypothetical protein